MFLNLKKLHFGQKKDLDLKTRLKLQLEHLICIGIVLFSSLTLVQQRSVGLTTKPEHEVSNLSYISSFLSQVKVLMHQLVVPVLEHLGVLLVVVVGAWLLLLSWALLAGSCLLLHWVNVQAEQSSEPLSWKYKNYFSCQTSTNAHNQFLTCCGIIESAKQFLCVENSPSYAQMSFWIGKRTNITATANANNLPWQTDWQLPSQPPAPPAPPPPWPAPACHTPPPPSCHIAAARWMGEPSSRLVWWDVLGVRWGGDITQNSPGHWVSWFLIIFQTCPETLSAHSSSLVLVVTDRRHFDYCYIWNVKYKLTSHSVTTATTEHPQWSAFVTPCLAAVSITIQSVRYFIIHFTPSDSWEIINSCLKLVLAR